jgi:hypothetical protein
MDRRYENTNLHRTYHDPGSPLSTSQLQYSQSLTPNHRPHGHYNDDHGRGHQREYQEDDRVFPPDAAAYLRAPGASPPLGTKSNGLLDDEDEEEVDAGLDVTRIQNHSNFPPPGQTHPLSSQYNEAAAISPRIPPSRTTPPRRRYHNNRGLFDDEDEEVDAGFDVARIQNYSNFPPPGRTPPLSSQYNEAMVISPPRRQYHNGEIVGEEIAFGMVVDDDFLEGDDYNERTARVPVPHPRHPTASTTPEAPAAVRANVDRTMMPPSRPHDLNDRATMDKIQMPPSRSLNLNNRATMDEVLAPPSRTHHLNESTSTTAATSASSIASRNHSPPPSFPRVSSSSSETRSPLDKAVRRARVSMAAFQQKDSPEVHLKPEELPPLPCPAGTQEPSLLHKTSRRCLERIRRGPGDRHSTATLVTGVLLRQRPTPQQQHLMTVDCDHCHRELLVPKSALMVRCPECRNVSPAGARRAAS